MNTHESYVSLETAKLLKEAGFDWNCVVHYHNGVINNIYSEEHNYNSKEYDDGGYNVYYSAPTLAVAQRWLREEKNKLVHVISYRDNGSDKVAGYCFKVYELSQGWEYNYFTYEEALEAGIRKCLIKILED